MTAKDDTARAPKGKVLLRVYIGRYAQEDVTPYEDARLLAMAQTEIRETLGISASPSFHRVIRYPNGIPQYNMGHLARIAAIEARLESHPGLFMAGHTDQNRRMRDHGPPARSISKRRKCVAHEMHGS